MYTIILVCFIMTMFLWLLTMIGAMKYPEHAGIYPPWLAWFACLFLGIAVFVAGLVQTGILKH